MINVSDIVHYDSGSTVRKVFILNHNTTGILSSKNGDAPYKWDNDPFPIQPPLPLSARAKKKTLENSQFKYAI